MRFHAIRRVTFRGSWQLALLALAWLAPRAVSAADPLPDDSSVLKVVAPASTRVYLDDEDRGTEREFRFDRLSPRRVHPVRLSLRFPDGTREDRTVILMPGRRVQVTFDGAQRPELMVQRGNTGNVSSLAYSPDGRYLYVGCEGGVLMWEVSTSLQVRRFQALGRRVESSLRFSNSVTSLSVSPDGTRLLAGAEDGNVYVWDVTTGELINSDEGWIGNPGVAAAPDGTQYAIGGNILVTIDAANHEGLQWLDIPRSESTSPFIRHVAYGPRQASLVAALWQAVSSRTGSAASYQHLLAAWDLSSGKLKYRYRVHDDRIQSLAMSPDGVHMATGSDDGSAVIWKAETCSRVHTIKGLEGDVEAVAFNSIGRLLLGGSSDKRDSARLKVWSVETGKLVREIRTLPVACLAVSPGDQIAVGHTSGAVTLWDLESGRQQGQLQGTASETESLALSPDGTKLAVSLDDSPLGLWDFTQGEYRRLADSPPELSADGLAFSRDSQRIAAVDFDDVYVWDAQSGRSLLSATQKGHSFDDLDVVGEGAKLVLVGEDAQDKAILQLFDVATGRAEITRYIPGSRTFFSGQVALSRDDRRIVVGALPKGVLYDADGLRELRTFAEPMQQAGTITTGSFADFDRYGDLLLTGAWRTWRQDGTPVAAVQGHDAQISCLAVTPDGKQLLTVGWDNLGILWDVETGRAIRKLVGHTGQVESVDISSDGRFAVTGGQDGRVFLWNLATGERMRMFSVDSEPIFSVALSPDGRLLLAGSKNRTAILWHTFSGHRERTFSGDNYSVAAVDFSPDGSRVLTGSGNGTASVWERQGGRRVFTLRGHGDGVFSASFSPDGRRIATGSIDKTVILWDAATGQRLRTLKWHSNHINNVRFSPDSKRLLSACWDNACMLWDVETGDRVRAFRSSSVHGVPAVQFSPDGRHVFTGSLDRSAVMWDVESGARVRTFGAPTMVNSADLSDDGTLVAAGTRAGRLLLHEATTGRQVREFDRGAVGIEQVTLSSDGQLLFTGLTDGTVELWDVATGDRLASLLSLNQGLDWLVITPEGLFDGTQAGRQLVRFRVGGRLQLVAVDRFFQDFYHPGLLAELMRGERPRPTGEFAGKSAPLVRILAPEAEATVSERQIQLRVEINDQGGGIDGPWLMHNGARILAQGTQVREGKTLQHEFTVSLIEGENTFEVRAASADGSWESEPARITIRFAERQEKPALWLLAVGVNRYASETMNLRFAAADAQAMARVFSERGPALYGEGQVHVATLLDEKATRAEIERVLGLVAQRANPQDTLVLFLAGHGMTLGQRYYFVPHEFQARAERLEDDLRQQGIPHDGLGDMLAKVPALKRIIVLDTCQSGGALPVTLTSRDPFAFRGALERLSRTQGVFTIAATAATTEAKEVPQLGHGLLTYALLAGLGAVDRGPLSDQRVRVAVEHPVVEVRDWFGFAQDKVPLLTRLYFGQEQFIGYSGSGASFPVLPLPAARQPNE